MTQEEIDKFLANTKVYVAGKSKEIQEKLFYLGYKLCNNTKDVQCTDKPFLYLDKDKKISFGHSMTYFTTIKFREITSEKILSLEITEPTYRPFKDKNECWNTMLKHEPFGLVKYYDIFISIISIDDYGVEYLYEKELVNLDYSESLRYLKFIDGMPFGIKKE